MMGLSALFLPLKNHFFSSFSHRDKDHDGKLTFQEFFENLFDEVYEPPEFEHFEPHHLDHPEKGDEKKAREMFHNLDTNNDG